MPKGFTFQSVSRVFYYIHIFISDDSDLIEKKDTWLPSLPSLNLIKEWMLNILIDSSSFDAAMEEDDDFITFSNPEYTWNFQDWEDYPFETVILERLEKLEKVFSNKKSQYQGLKADFHKMFDEELGSDNEDMFIE